MELDKISIDVLKSLIYPESMEKILEEQTEKAYVVKDVLKDLIKLRLVKAKLPGDHEKWGIYFDSDNMFVCQYQITAKGLDCLA